MGLAIIGCGQLARMMAMAARDLGVSCSFVACGGESTRCVDGLGGVVQWPGEEADVAALYLALGRPDVVTVEREDVSLALLRTLAAHCAVYPDPKAVSHCQHRLRERELLDSLAIPVAPYRAARSIAEVKRAVRELGFPVVVKQACSGYDGKKQWRIRSESDLSGFVRRRPSGEWLVEKWVPFERELSLVAARSTTGEIAAYPVTQNWHQDGILRRSLAPAPDLRDGQDRLALQFMKSLLESMNYVGVLAMECFVVEGRLLVNELAPRVHNSGHWTQQGGVTSQFENHLRALTGLPLGATVLSGYVGMVNILGERPAPACYSALTGSASLHWYNKEPRPDRKLGHILVSAVEPEQVLLRLAWVHGMLGGERSVPTIGSDTPEEHVPLPIPPDSPAMPASQQ